MAQSLEARLVISAQDRTGAVMDAIGRKLDALARKAKDVDRAGRTLARTDAVAGGMAARSGSGGRVAGVMDRVGAAGYGRLAGALGALAGGVAIRESVTRYAEVERRFTRIGITAEATRAEMRALTAEAQKMSIAMAMPLDKIADGFEALAAQGKNLAQMRAMMPAIARTAQASGADVSDIAKSSGALADNMAIAPTDMQKAFDLLVGGGKAGQFELKDMARYLPAIAPQAAAVGMRGMGGLAQLVALAQTVRRGSGSSEEAASSLSNIFAKMESEETAKRFSKFGVDLRKEMAGARKEGKNLLEVFTQLTDKALKGDLSKLPQLFSDMEFARGMRAIMSLPGYLKQVSAALKNVDGTTMRDVNTIFEDSKTKLDRMAASWDRLKTKAGEAIAVMGAGKAMNWVSDSIQLGLDDADRYQRGETTFGEQNTRTAWNWLTTGQGVNQAPSELVQPHQDKAFRDRYAARIEEMRKAHEFWQGMNKRSGRDRFLTEVNRSGAGLADLEGAMAAHDETAVQVAEVQGQRQRIARARINGRFAPAPITPGLLSFGLNGYPVGDTVYGGVPASRIPQAAPSAAPTPSLERLEDIFTSGKMKTEVSGDAKITITLEPAGEFVGLLRRVERIERMALSNGPGSTGAGQAGSTPGRMGPN
jgi:TP901 family phage tail tape measure protein